MTGRLMATDQIADCIAIRELVAGFNVAADASDGDAAADYYVADGVFDVEGVGTFVGRHEISGVVSSAKGLRHVTTDHIVVIEGDIAVQTCTLLLFQRSEDRSRVDLVTTGSYRNELTRTPEGWRFVRREVSVDLEGAALLAKTHPAGLLED
jgi:ketosteroid isomerase-like protein